LLLQLANRADEPDPWRQAVREAVVRRDDKELVRLANETENGKPTPGVVLLLTSRLGSDSAEATALLRRLQRERPDDFWISFALGGSFGQQKKYQEAAECYLVTVALRPDSAAAHNNLGAALKEKGQ